MRRDIPSHKFHDGLGRETAASRAYQAIRERILRCELKPGAAINERHLMDEISIGRTPVREALLRLSAEGLVIFSGQGIHVAPVTLQSIAALYTARLHAERLAWQLWMRAAAAGADGRERIARLAAAFETAGELAKRDDEEGLVDLDFRFHSQVYEECGNSFLTGHLYNLTGLSFRVWFLANPHQLEHHLQTIRSHDPIIAAVQAHDMARLDREVSDHITNAFHTVIERMKGHDVGVAASLPLRLPQ
jgi:GntR family transcriptional regulator, rspAB operon transcriptional repressor